MRKFSYCLFILLACVFILGAAGDKKKYIFQIPLNGQLITSEDPAVIRTNFRTLTNLRYTDTHVKGIGGMTKINTTAISVAQDLENYTEVDGGTTITIGVEKAPEATTTDPDNDADVTTGWTAKSSATLSSEGSGNTGNCLKILENGANNPYAESAAMTVTAGRQYSLSFYHKDVDGTSDDPTWCVYGATTANEINTEGAPVTLTAAAAWENVVDKFIAPATENATIQFLHSATSADGDAYYFDDTTFIEVVDQIEFLATTEDEDGYVYYDFGADYFGGDFEFFVDLNVSAEADGIVWGWGLANTLDDFNGIDTASGDFIGLKLNGASTAKCYVRLQACNAGTLASSTDYEATLSTDYYLSIKRDTSVGTYGTVYLYVYSDSARTTLLSTQTLTLTEDEDFRYLYAFSSHDSNDGTDTLTGIVSNLSIATRKIKTGFHYTPKNPTESHILVQADDGDGNTFIVDNTTAIPDAGNFSTAKVLAEEGAADTGMWAVATNGDLIYTNKEHVHIWGGDEYPQSSVISSTAVITNTVTNPRDYTIVLQNDTNNAKNSMTLGGIDTDTYLLLHNDGADTEAVAIADSSTSGPSGNADTVNDDAQLTTAKKKFGTASLDLERGGTDDSVEWNDHAGWDFDSGNFTIEAWVDMEGNVEDGNNETIASQYDDATHYWYFYIRDPGDGHDRLYFYMENGAATISLTSDQLPVGYNESFQHFAVIRGWGGNANDYALTYNGTLIGSGTDTDDMPNFTNPLEIGATNGVKGLDGQIDELRISKVARWTSNFTPNSEPYTTDTRYWLVGATRPLQGVKYYIGDANTTTGTTLTVQEWNGSGWETLTSVDNNFWDGTAVQGISMAQTGSVTWDSTENTSRLKYIEGKLLYWYQFYLDTAGADPRIYYITVDAAMQPITDIWDGAERPTISFQIYEDSIYKDRTLAVYEEDFTSVNTNTYASIDGLAGGTEFLFIGFPEPQTGISVVLAPNEENDTAGTDIVVSYWDGIAWANATAIVDGTQTTTISLSQSGVVSWQQVEPGQEHLKNLVSGVPLYYYRLEFDENIGTSVDIDYIGGIPASKVINPYNSVLVSGNAVWLLGESDRFGNKVLRSAVGTSEVFNGDRHLEFFVGTKEDIVAGGSIFYQFGSNIYEAILVLKESETWLLVPEPDGSVRLFQISDRIGCVAPSTLKIASKGTADVTASGIIALWQGADGIYMFDGNSISKVSQAIDDLFDLRLSNLNRDAVGESYGFIDIPNWEYHWVYPTGSATVPDEEHVYDIKRNRWYEVGRGSAKDLQCGFLVRDTGGNTYSYGGIATGYLERLGYGNDFDGNDIVHALRFGDISLPGPGDEVGAMGDTVPRAFKLITKATNTTTNTVAVSYYKDCNTSADYSFTLAPQASGKNVAQDVHSLGGEGPATFHDFSLSMTTDNEVVGFEPIFCGIIYQWKRYDEVGGN